MNINFFKFLKKFEINNPESHVDPRYFGDERSCISKRSRWVIIRPTWHARSRPLPRTLRFSRVKGIKFLSSWKIFFENELSWIDYKNFKKYPDENSFSKFLKENGGQHNAATSHSSTTYFFDIRPGKVVEGVERLIDMVSNPLLNKNSIAREIKGKFSKERLKILWFC